MSAIATKDHLFHLINNSASAGELIDVIDKVIIPILLHTEGFWLELRYCYKAAEIADRCISALDHFLTDGVHAARGKRIENYKDKMRNIGDRYRLLQANQ